MLLLPENNEEPGKYNQEQHETDIAENYKHILNGSSHTLATCFSPDFCGSR